MTGRRSCASPRRGAVVTWLAAAALALASAGAALAEPNDVAAGDWPQFRGHHRDGMSPATGLLDSWPEEGPKELWRVSLGEGYSAVSIAGGRLYTMYAEVPPEAEPAAEGEEAAAEGEGAGEEPAEPAAEAPKTEYAAAFDAATGKELWRTAIGQRIVTQFGNGPRSTPAVDGDTVYVLGAHGDLAALAAADGAVRWQIEFEESFGSNRPHWGYATSSLVEGDLLLVESQGPEGKAYAALDKATGEVRWTTGDPSPHGSYNSPMAVTMGGERRFVYVGNQVVRAVDTGGQEVWSHPWPEGESHAMPIFIPPDRFFVSGAEGVGAALLRVQGDGDGVKVEELWQNRIMKNHFSSSLLHEGSVYGFDNATLKCISLDTGEQQWAKRGLGKGSLIYADGHLIVLSDRGRLVQVEATPEGYVEKGRVQALDGKCWTAPTLAGGRLYLRSHTEMVSYDLNG